MLHGSVYSLGRACLHAAFLADTLCAALRAGLLGHAATPTHAVLAARTGSEERGEVIMCCRCPASCHRECLPDALLNTVTACRAVSWIASTEPGVSYKHACLPACLFACCDSTISMYC